MPTPVAEHYVRECPGWPADGNRAVGEDWGLPDATSCVVASLATPPGPLTGWA